MHVKDTSQPIGSDTKYSNVGVVISSIPTVLADSALQRIHRHTSPSQFPSPSWVVVDRMDFGSGCSKSVAAAVVAVGFDFGMFVSIGAGTFDRFGTG